jgi:hypothetical protein
MLRADEKLKEKIEARKQELLTKYNQLKSDAGADAAATRARVKRQLDELELHLKGGWDKLSESVRSKLGTWLERDRE